MGFKISERTFIISDSHFGHGGVLKKEPMRLEVAKAHGYEDFDSFQTMLWNNAVGKKDKILHLGDLFFPGGFSRLKALNGKKLLLLGNNDIKRYKKLNDLASWRIHKGLELLIPERKAILKKLYSHFGKCIIKEDIFLNAIVLDVGGERVMFSHFPVFAQKSYDRYTKTREGLDMLFSLSNCTLNIHGHIHSRPSPHPFCFNASCENIAFIPRTLGEILSMWRYGF